MAAEQWADLTPYTLANNEWNLIILFQKSIWSEQRKFVGGHLSSRKQLINDVVTDEAKIFTDELAKVVSEDIVYEWKWMVATCWSMVIRSKEAEMVNKRPTYSKCVYFIRKYKKFI
jgi:hypothetical protein